MIEYKDFLGGVKDVDAKGRVITGYLSAFGNKDFDGDIIEKGAFTKSINERKNQIFFLNQHNWQQPLTKFQVLREDEKGLYFESRPLPDTSYANDVMKLYEAGILNEHSIGFNVIKADYDRDTDIRHIKEIKLYEGSVVTLGANSSTPFTGFKALTIEDFDKEQKRLEAETKKLLKAYRNGDYTDDTFILMEIAIKQLQKQSFELGKISLKEPFNDTHEGADGEEKEVEILNEYLTKWN
ncbi:HK97 family phage prohead protease [Flagellimonas sp. SN16]|uniref:HK97 family phage prohead protease n=1 Tax=Flagellimonas sp. SN16 TaxID=3415142 RepID=UPI003C5EA862